MAEAGSRDGDQSETEQVQRRDGRCGYGALQGCGDLGRRDGRGVNRGVRLRRRM